MSDNELTDHMQTQVFDLLANAPKKIPYDESTPLFKLSDDMTKRLESRVDTRPKTHHVIPKHRA